MLLLQTVVIMEQKATQYGKNLQLVCIWWYIQTINHENGDSISVTHTGDIAKHFPGFDVTTFRNCK